MGFVIINADDWGETQATTDAILECYVAGRLTSTTAMVYMEDSCRAAELALQHRVPVGLHVNLTTPFTSTSVPEAVRRRQIRLTRFFCKSRYARWFYNPLIANDVASALSDQIEAFTALYGQKPTHVDGHHHIHVSANVLSSRAIPSGWKMRRSFTFLPGEKPLPNRLWRKTFNFLMARRFPGTDYFFDVNSVDFNRRGDTALPRKLALFEAATVEVMCHPALADDFALLMSSSWSGVIDRLPTRSYEAVQGAE